MQYGCIGYGLHMARETNAHSGNSVSKNAEHPNRCFWFS